MLSSLFGSSTPTPPATPSTANEKVGKSPVVVTTTSVPPTPSTTASGSSSYYSPSTTPTSASTAQGYLLVSSTSTSASTWTSPPPVKYPYKPEQALDDIPGLQYALKLFLESKMVESEEYCHKSDEKKCVSFLSFWLGVD